MPWNGSGVFNRIYSWVADKNGGLDIIASRMDTDTDDITSNGFGNCVTRDGQGQPAASIIPNTTNAYDLGSASFTWKNAWFSGVLAVTGHTTFEGVTSTGATGTGKLVYSIAPTFTGTVGFAALSGTGNIATSVGNISTAGFTVAADGGSGAFLTMTGFGNNAVYNWGSIAASANFQVVAGGSGGVILNNGTSSWAAVSDYRRKDVFGPFDTSGEIIDAVPVHLAAMKDKPDVHRAMFLAHELQAKVGHAVHGEKDGEHMQIVETTDPLVPILWAEIRSMRKRLAALERA